MIALISPEGNHRTAPDKHMYPYCWYIFPMLSIAIIEDDPRESSSLKQKLESVFAPRQIEAKIEIFENPLVFLPRNTAQYDIMFFDIEMRG